MQQGGAARARSFWGWGREGEGPPAAQVEAMEAGLQHWLGVPTFAAVAPPSVDEIDLAPPRVEAPADLSHLVSAQKLDRLSHTYGKSYRDIVRALARTFDNPPDYVAFPRSEADIVRVLEWCDRARLAVIPYGGGSSVCGGVEARLSGAHLGAVSLDLSGLDQLLELDPVSRAAQLQGGIMGPALEASLRPHGLSLRHYPQSFEFSSLGGWIATRAGGHFATLYTHIDDFVESLRVITPSGTIESRRLPGSGAGPSTDRLFIGSEGALGVITSAWVRLQERPRFRAQATVGFQGSGEATDVQAFLRGARALRAIVQAGLFPANCRLLDPMEALLNQANGAGGGEALLLLGFESADHPLHARMQRAVTIARDHGGRVDDSSISYSAEDAEQRSRADAQGAWRSAFLRAPYLRDALIARGVFTETFETAATWDRFESLHQAVYTAARQAMRDTGGAGVVSCRITHAYPDGAAPYFTLIAPAARGAELAQWDTIKAAITDAMLAHGGSVTHHHAVGRDFMPWYLQQRSPGFGRALAAVKRELDPQGIMNPGVLIPVEAP